MIIREKVRIGDQVVTLETGRIAKQAGGSCLVRAGDTIVLVTACGNQEPKVGQSFFPLSVDYIEKTYAAGKIPGGFFKREGKLRDYEVLTSRLIDRPCRPLFPEGYLSEVQVVATVMSFDQQNPPDTLAMVGASAALHMSQMPWNGPIAGVRVGRIQGEFVANPTYAQMAESDCELLVAASRDAIVMVEGEADEMSEEDLIEALLFGHAAVQDTIELIDRMRHAVGKPKWNFVGDTTPAILRERVRQVAVSKMREACSIANKAARGDAFKQIRRETLEILAPEFPSQEEWIKSAYEDLRYSTMRGQVLEEGRRLDGRDTRTVRPISIDLGVLPRTHGSSLFTRGETQAIVTTTLGTSRDAQRLDTLQGDQMKRFLLHYNFPPYSVGECKPMRGPGRREVGHGDLAERALLKVLPSQEEFPYTIRIVSEITESNGSSSMASVCGGALALMDAGVPIKSAVAGVAMGLIKEGERYAVLTDILGDEDALGDMDFKVCGTEKGVTAIQMDIKIEGLSREILERALTQAREARLHILDKMQRAITAPREELSQFAPRITQIRVKPDQVRTIIGPGGKMIRAIVDQTGANIDVEDDGTVNVSSADSSAVAKALDIIKSLTTEPEIGTVYEGTVKRIEPYGAFIEIMPGKDGLCHISDIDWTHVTSVEDYVKLGDKVTVKLTNIDREGRIRLSRKDAMPEPAGAVKSPRVGEPREERSFDRPREDRPSRPRNFDRDERSEKPRFGDRDRPARDFDREERPAARARDLDERPAARVRDFDRDERPATRVRDLDRDERAIAKPRDLDREERVIAKPRDLDREERPLGGKPRDLDREERAIAKPRDLDREERAIAKPRDLDREERAITKPRDLDREERAIAKPRDLDREERAITKPRDLDREERAITKPRDLDREERPLGGKPRDLDREERPVIARARDLDREERPLGGKPGELEPRAARGRDLDERPGRRTLDERPTGRARELDREGRSPARSRDFEREERPLKSRDLDERSPAKGRDLDERIAGKGRDLVRDERPLASKPRDLEREERVPAKSRDFEREERPAARGRDLEREERVPTKSRDFEREERPAARGRDLEREERVPAKSRDFEREERPLKSRELDDERALAKRREFTSERPARVLDRSAERVTRPRDLDRDERALAKPRDLDRDERALAKPRDLDRDERALAKSRDLDRTSRVREEEPRSARTLVADERDDRPRGRDLDRPAGREDAREIPALRGVRRDLDERTARPRELDREPLPKARDDESERSGPTRGRDLAGRSGARRDLDERPTAKGRDLDRELLTRGRRDELEPAPRGARREGRDLDREPPVRTPREDELEPRSALRAPRDLDEPTTARRGRDETPRVRARDPEPEDRPRARREERDDERGGRSESDRPIKARASEPTSRVADLPSREAPRAKRGREDEVGPEAGYAGATPAAAPRERDERFERDRPSRVRSRARNRDRVRELERERERERD